MTCTLLSLSHRIKDTAKKMNADNHSDYIHHVLIYEYDPRDRLTKKTKSTPGGSVVDTETYVHDANNNVIEQTVDGTKTTYNYDRNRLLSSNISGTTATYNYDPFGRLDRVTAAGKQIEKYKYDGFDRVQEQSQIQEDGSTKTTKYTYDPLDRTTSRTEGTKTTDFNYLGLSDEVFSEEVAGKIQKSYQYSPWGERLSMVKHKSDGTEEDSYYGYNPHTDVEVLTDEKGDTRATYGYTAYGKNDEDEFTGVDKPDPQTPDQEPYNVYRFNSKRWDASTGEYDMGFRNYDPGLNRFLTRDMYNGAMDDMNLATDPWNNNRYAFAGGNPISMVELDGHRPVEVMDGHITAEEYHQVTGHTIGGVKTSWKPAMSRAKARIEQREIGKATAEYKKLLDLHPTGNQHYKWLSNKYIELDKEYGNQVARIFLLETSGIRLSLDPGTAMDPSAQGYMLVGAGFASVFGKRFKGGGGSGENAVKAIPLSSQKMHQLGKHFNKHGRGMGFSSKKEYDQAAKDFAKKYQKDPKAQIWEGIWNGKGSLAGQTQRAVIHGNNTVILDPISGQVIDFYQGTQLGGLINLRQLR